MKAEEFDKKSDRCEDVSDFLDIENARRPEREQKHANVHFPIWMIPSLFRRCAFSDFNLRKRLAH